METTPTLSFPVPANWLKALLKVAAKKDIRYYLNGILLQPVRVMDEKVTVFNGIVAVATDGHRLVTCGIKLDDDVSHMTEAAKQADAIIPRETVEHLLKAHFKADLPDPMITMTLDESKRWQFEWATGGARSSGKGIEGKFPSWRRVTSVPKGYHGKDEFVGVNPTYLKDFCDIAALVGFDKKRPEIVILPHGSDRALEIGLGHELWLGMLMPLRYGCGVPHPAFLDGE